MPCSSELLTAYNTTVELDRSLVLFMCEIMREQNKDRKNTKCLEHQDQNQQSRATFHFEQGYNTNSILCSACSVFPASSSARLPMITPSQMHYFVSFWPSLHVEPEQSSHPISDVLPPSSRNPCLKPRPSHDRHRHHHPQPRRLRKHP